MVVGCKWSLESSEKEKKGETGIFGDYDIRSTLSLSSHQARWC